MVAAALTKTDDRRAELTRIAGSSALPHRLVVPAKALLWAVDGCLTRQEIACRSGVCGEPLRRMQAPRGHHADHG